jgi:diguanylate cyclase (GGDEF)-like protein
MRPLQAKSDHLIRLGVVTYIFALSLIAAFTIAFHFLTDSIVQHQQDTAAIVNISGRQRMLSQRIAKLSLERAAHYQFRPDALSQTSLLDAIALMDSSHHALLYGSPELHLPAPTAARVRDIYFSAPWLLDLQMQDFLAHARAFAARPSAQLNLTDPDLLAIQRAAQSPLLDALNAAVTANQQVSEQAIGTLRRVLTSLTLLMLLILMLEALLLYRPLFNRLARAHVELVVAGRTDPLTGCLNRRAFTLEAHNAVSHARQLEQPLAVLMLDIDRFKNVNDRHGHPAGDRVINSVVGTLLMTIRNTDTLCRMGGEEFAVMLPNETLPASADIAERIRAAVEATHVPSTTTAPPPSTSLSASASPSWRTPTPRSSTSSAAPTRRSIAPKPTAATAWKPKPVPTPPRRSRRRPSAAAAFSPLETLR